MTNQTVIPLTDLEVPAILPEQIAKFSLESIHVSPVGQFNPEGVFRKLSAAEGKRVIGADFGGDKGATKLYRVSQGKLIIENDYEDYIQSDDGMGYLASLEKTARFAEKYNLPVGLSIGFGLEGTKPQNQDLDAKLSILRKELNQKYGYDFAKISPTTFNACLNDGPAGLISGAIAAYRLSLAKTILFSINGGGLGMGVLSNRKIYATEAGHAEAVAELNQYSQTGPCGVCGAKYVCMELLGANKAGIEVQWLSKTDQNLSAKEIEDRYKAGDELARELYDHSALIVAHQILGTAHCFDLDLSDKGTTIVGHGGAYKFPHYGARVGQILAKHLGTEPKFILTKDYSENACAEGVAIAALTQALPAAASTSTKATA